MPHISINQAQFLAFRKIRAIKVYLHNRVITGAVPNEIKKRRGSCYGPTEARHLPNLLVSANSNNEVLPAKKESY